jgi:hypothetical protein
MELQPTELQLTELQSIGVSTFGLAPGESERLLGSYPGPTRVLPGCQPDRLRRGDPLTPELSLDFRGSLDFSRLPSLGRQPSPPGIPGISVFLLAVSRNDRGNFFPGGRKAFYAHADLPRSLRPRCIYGDKSGGAARGIVLKQRSVPLRIGHRPCKRRDRISAAARDNGQIRVFRAHCLDSRLWYFRLGMVGHGHGCGICSAGLLRAALRCDPRSN